jgi:hypothetical protein
MSIPTNPLCAFGSIASCSHRRLSARSMFSAPMRRQTIILASALFWWTFSTAASAPSLKASVTMPAKIEQCHLVPATLTIRNGGQNTFSLLKRIGARQTRLRIRRAASATDFYAGIVDGSRAASHGNSRGPSTLAPGETLSYSFLLCSRWANDKPIGAVFEESGKCRIQFEIDLGHVVVDGDAKLVTTRTDWIDLNIVSPSRSESRALARIMTMPNRGWLFEPQEMPSRNSLVTLRQFEADLARFVKSYPQSYWAPHAHIALAHIYEFWARENRGIAAKEKAWREKSKQSVERGLGATRTMSPGVARKMLLDRERKPAAGKPRASVRITNAPPTIKFKLADDDDSSLLPGTADLTVLTAALAEAYVDVLNDEGGTPGNNQTDATFVLNVRNYSGRSRSQGWN